MLKPTAPRGSPASPSDTPKGVASDTGNFWELGFGRAAIVRPWAPPRDDRRSLSGSHRRLRLSSSPLEIKNAKLNLKTVPPLEMQSALFSWMHLPTCVHPIGAWELHPCSEFQAARVRSPMLTSKSNGRPLRVHFSSQANMATSRWWKWRQAFLKTKGSYANFKIQWATRKGSR